MFDLTGRTALVTGAGQGVGFGIAATLLEAGARVFVNDLVPERAEAAAGALGASATALPFSVADREAVASAIAGIGPIDILVNNAGIPPTMRPVKFRDMDPAEWAAYIDVNLYGVINCVSVTIDEMCERGWGRVITISSGAGTQGLNIGVSLYGAGKGGAISFMRHLDRRVAHSHCVDGEADTGRSARHRTRHRLHLRVPRLRRSGVDHRTDNRSEWRLGHELNRVFRPAEHSTPPEASYGVMKDRSSSAIEAAPMRLIVRRMSSRHQPSNVSTPASPAAPSA
jgi:NADP-dependent 3-hydroxy acid dehydrogenase YdfG